MHVDIVSMAACNSGISYMYKYIIVSVIGELSVHLYVYSVRVYNCIQMFYRQYMVRAYH